MFGQGFDSPQLHFLLLIQSSVLYRRFFFVHTINLNQEPLPGMIRLVFSLYRPHLCIPDLTASKPVIEAQPDKATDEFRIRQQLKIIAAVSLGDRLKWHEKVVAAQAYRILALSKVLFTIST